MRSRDPHLLPSHDRGRDPRARLGRGRRRVRHRRRLRRSSVLRDGDPRPRPRGAGFRVAILSQPDWRSADAVAALRPAPPVLRASSAGNMDSMINHYTANRKVRNGRRLLARRPHRPAARPRDARVLPAVPRGVPRRAGDRRRRRGLAPPARPLRLLERHGQPSILLDARPTSSSSAWASTRSSRSRGGSRRARRSKDLRDMRGVAYLLGGTETLPALPDAMRAAGTPADRHARAPVVRGGRRRQGRVRARDADDPHETNPFNARGSCSATATGVVVQNPPALPITPADMDRIYGLPYSGARTRCTREPIPAVRDDQGRASRSCAAASAAARSARSPRTRAASSSRGREESVLTSASAGPGPGVQGHRHRHRRPDRQHVPDALHAARSRGHVPAALVRASRRLQAARHRPRPARRADEEGARGARASRRSSSPPASAWTSPQRRPST